MMKPFCTLALAVTLSGNLSAQALRVITMKEDKLTQLIFPAAIKSFKGGFLPSDFAMSAEDNVAYIQPMGTFPESNLNIITADGNYYTVTIRYDPGANVFNFIFTPQDAIYNDRQVDPLPDMEVREERITPKEPPRRETPMAAKAMTDPQYDSICRRILRSSGYLMTRNVEKLKNFSVILKGVYIDRQNIYLRLILDNNSNIKYDIEYMAFYVEALLKARTASQEKVQLQPRYIFNQAPAVNPKSSLELICCFDKFTIGPEKALHISLIEKGGERTLDLQVHNNTILDARRYE